MFPFIFTHQRGDIFTVYKSHLYRDTWVVSVWVVFLNKFWKFLKLWVRVDNQRIILCVVRKGGNAVRLETHIKFQP